MLRVLFEHLASSEEHFVYIDRWHLSFGNLFRHITSIL
jgi:hypothetical protein